ncbi:DUF4142 domain-containing protein [Methylocystis sp. JAN1]|uniref:DUF4142 domain-containing protein n=1 Tax=Methylocystis sp. JAN1 TaxID=3397211 RepID=UPI003FA32B3C
MRQDMRLGHWALAFVMLASPALAQAPGPAPANPAFAPPAASEKGKSEAPQLNDADRVFIGEARMAGAFQSDLAKLADEKRANADIMEFSARMAKGDAAAAQRFDALGARPEAIGGDRRRAAIFQELKGLNSQDFQRRYWAIQTAEHQAAAQLLAYEIGSGLNSELKGLAADMLPSVYRHLRQAQASAAAPPKQ